MAPREPTFSDILLKSHHKHDLKTFLTWLCFSARELRIEELADVVTVDMQAQDVPQFDPDLRYMDPRDVLAVCSGLVVEDNGKSKLIILFYYQN